MVEDLLLGVDNPDLLGATVPVPEIVEEGKDQVPNTCRRDATHRATFCPTNPFSRCHQNDKHCALFPQPVLWSTILRCLARNRATGKPATWCLHPNTLRKVLPSTMGPLCGFWLPDGGGRRQWFQPPGRSLEL